MPRFNAFSRDIKRWGFRRPDAPATRLSFLVVTTIGILFVALWWWSGLTDQGDDSEITVLGTGELEASRQEISRRLREEGFSLRWAESINTWCDLRDEIPARVSGIIVVSAGDLDECADSSQEILDELEEGGYLAQMVIVDLEFPVQKNALIQQIIDGGGRRVATERLIGAIDEERPCVWWEDCGASGGIVTRTKLGLTASGQDRLARLITATLV